MPEEGHHRRPSKAFRYKINKGNLTSHYGRAKISVNISLETKSIEPAYASRGEIGCMRGNAMYQSGGEPRTFIREASRRLS